MKTPKQKNDAAAIAKNKRILKLARAIDEILTNPETPADLHNAVGDALNEILNEAHVNTDRLKLLRIWLPDALADLEKTQERCERCGTSRSLQAEAFCARCGSQYPKEEQEAVVRKLVDGA